MLNCLSVWSQDCSVWSFRWELLCGDSGTARDHSWSCWLSYRLSLEVAQQHFAHPPLVTTAQASPDPRGREGHSTFGGEYCQRICGHLPPTTLSSSLKSICFKFAWGSPCISNKRRPLLWRPVKAEVPPPFIYIFSVQIRQLDFLRTMNIQLLPFNINMKTVTFQMKLWKGMGIYGSSLRFWQRDSWFHNPLAMVRGGRRFGNHCGLLKESCRRILRKKVGYTHANRRSCGRTADKGKEVKGQESRVSRDSTMEMTTSRIISGMLLVLSRCLFNGKKN